jgi:DNA (cytosine-5)-methyltransferase 1
MHHSGGDRVIVDGFSGPRGWSEGSRMLGLSDVGIEIDAAACATAKAAGHLTIRADVASYPTGPFVGKTEGAIFSPPCQAFSQAGKGDGVKAMAVLARAAWDVAGGADVPRLDLDDDRAELVLEPVRWVRDLRPRWVALEQVPTVLPLWELYAHIFGQFGYRCWTGKLNAANYGVPQTRERAILLASLDRQPSCPAATHCEGGEPESMFGAGRVPWVTMAQALGWYGEFEVKLQRGRGMIERHGDRPGRREDQPAPTIRAGSGGGGCGTNLLVLRSSAMEHAAVRSIDEPAPTVLGSWDNGDARWQWTQDRPATTVCADPRLSPPGWRGKPDDYDADGNYHGARSMDDAIRLTIRDALILQSFRPDYPVQGNKTKQFEQVGNAIPPLLAAHCIAAVTGRTLRTEAT